jgi:predicted component of type VI protein secretion system
MFAGVFRSPVQPAELAKALAKAMDRGRSVGVGKVYAPNVYTVLLSPDDDTKFGAFAETLAAELSTFLVGHARERDYDLASKPVVRFLVDDDLKIGRFDVIAELVSPDEIEAEMAEYGHRFSASSMVSTSPREAPRPRAPRSAAAPVAAAASAAAPAPHVDDITPAEAVPEPPAEAAAAAPRAAAAGAAPFATVTVTGIDHDVILGGDRVVIGRLASCDICLQDRNVSRQHAAFVARPGGWAIADLGSTNGTRLNGEIIDKAHLHDGDIVEIGLTRFVYHEPRR